MAGAKDLSAEIANWLKWDKNVKTRQEIADLVAADNQAELQSRMATRVVFGTAGIRAQMEAGFSRLNDLVIIQTSQGYASYVAQQFGEAAKARGIVIGYDGRHNSQRFAQLAALAFVQKSIKVYLYSRLAPTPLVAFAIRELNCVTGLCVTASHNPKGDNGYKVYWDNGAQIISPHDSGIGKQIEQNLIPWEHSWDVEMLKNNPLCEDVIDKVWQRYLESGVKHFCYYHEQNTKSDLKFAYTPFHGVGFYFAPELLERFGFSLARNVVFVEEQKLVDPDFPTVSFPNPEEGRPVLELSIQTADRHGCPLVLASDPDADRFQMAEKINGDWRIFTGNEQGGLLAWWRWEAWKRANPNKSGENVYMINSTVSSKFMRTIAEVEGFQYEETLTGFKWMGNRSAELKKLGKEVLLAWEESIGYMCGDHLDKDGIIAVGIFAEYAVYLYNQGKTFTQHLDDLYKKYGYHLSFISYFRSDTCEVFRPIFEAIRDHNGTKTYPPEIGGIKVKDIRDMGTGYDSSTKDRKPKLPWSKGTMMITFVLQDDSTVTIRASGTEPKLKFYLEVKTAPGGDSKVAEAKLEELKVATRQLLKADQFGLIPKEEA